MARIISRWLAYLSDGSVAIEGKHPYEEIPNEPSPWQRLLLHLAKNKLEITGLRIQIEKEGEPVRTFNLPSKSPKQKWADLKPLIPIGFNYFRRVQRTMEPIDGDFGNLRLGNEYHFIEIHAIYKGFTLVLIVDEDTGNESWSLILERG
jgi:hypothetical protein